MKLNQNQNNTKKKGSWFTKLIIVCGLLGILIYISKIEQQGRPDRFMMPSTPTMADGTFPDLKPGQKVHGEPPRKDYVVETDKNLSEITVYFWDYAAEDGDYVQILQNGQPITEPFLIENTPKQIRIPNYGSIQVKGIKDGFPPFGVSYALKFESGAGYVNLVPEGEVNTYTIR